MNAAFVVVSLIGVLCFVSTVFLKIAVDRFLSTYGSDEKKVWEKIVPLYFLMLAVALIGLFLFIALNG